MDRERGAGKGERSEDARHAPVARQFVMPKCVMRQAPLFATVRSGELV
ncbi:MAG: hypothetical protein H0X43_12225 [Nitrosospira sp.]|nr:hypothetical protein [Nitrosospira sp.]